MNLEFVSIVIPTAAAILAGLLWIIKAQVHMMREFKPNGGESTRDSLNRIEDDLRELRSRIDGHVEWHLND